MSPPTRPPGVGRICLWMLRYPARRKLALTGVLFTTLAGAGLRVLAPWPMKLIVDQVVGGQPLPTSVARWIEHFPMANTRDGLLTWCVLATVLLFLVGWIVGLAFTYANIALGQRMIYDLGADLFGHLQRLSLKFHGKRSVGDLIRRVTGDCSCVSTIVRDALLPVLSALIMLVSMFAIMWRMNATLALLSLGVVPLMVFTFRIFAKPMLETSTAQQEAESRIYTIVEQTLSAIPIVQAFRGEARALRSLRDGSDVAIDAAVAATRVQMGFKIGIGLATALGTAAILGIGAREALAGHLTAGGLLVFLAYLAALYVPLNTLAYTSSTIQGAAGSARRVIEIFDIDHEVRDRPGATALDRVTGELRFDNVNFGYEPGVSVLQGIDLHIPAGATIAIVGPSGAGKSTMAALVPRLFDPTGGTVSLDGHDLRDLRVASLRKHVAVVLQEAFLFPMTVAENISYGSDHATREQIETAARIAGADSFIRALPQGYDTLLGDRGMTLSGGERQRLSIARALLKDAPVLILDEPTANLDAATEASLLDALTRLMAGRTTILIAHRFSTVRQANLIVVIDRGRIVEQGTHDQLVTLNGAYARLYQLQLQGSGN